jgi:hypothetical protein
MRLKSVLFGIFLFLLANSLGGALMAASFWDLMLKRAGAGDALSAVPVPNRDAYAKVVGVLESRGYDYEPWTEDVVGGDILVRGDVRPVLPLVEPYVRGPVSVIVRGFEPSLHSLVALPVPLPAGRVVVYSIAAARLAAALYAAALVAVTWHALSRRHLGPLAALLIVLVPALMALPEAGYALATGLPAELFLAFSYLLAPPALVLLTWLAARALSRRR